ncbi:MAG: DUF1156 domain-containing protein [Bacteroidales bacterium]|nr:DUF1156 domain-containing protein [Bacteroidales bacterium]
MTYPKRLIEVNLPIKRISAHARREKSIRHGHISTLHIWWARRPLAACRAVLCASLWPDPADELCPKEFVEFAKKEMLKWSDNDHLKLLSKESIEHFIKVNHDKTLVFNKIFLRQLLLDFIADFANWDNSNQPEFLATSRALTQSAHIALGGDLGTNPMVVDPFAGGGSIPLEALRVGADVFASDLNPIPVLLNKVQLEYIPKYGQKLADEVRKWGALIKQEAEKELQEFYPAIKNPNLELYTPQLDESIKQNGKQWKLNRIIKETPLAYLWARTISCEGPNCGVEIPMMRSFWLAKKGKRIIALTLLPDAKKKKIDIKITEQPSSIVSDAGTVKRGSVSCPCCGFVTPVSSVRLQMKKIKGGANDAKIMAVVCNITTERMCQNSKKEYEETRRYYRVASTTDMDAFNKATAELQKRKENYKGILSLVPEELLPINPSVNDTSTTLGFRIQGYGMTKWNHLFSNRELLCLSTLIEHLHKLPELKDKQFDAALRTMLALAIDRQADYLTSLTVWANNGEFIAHTFGRQAIPMIWDFPECQIFQKFSGNWEGAFEWVALVIEKITCEFKNTGSSQISDATIHPMPDDSIACFFTDPPYYDAVPYADLSDFFYVWLKRSIGDLHPDLFKSELTNKKDECIVDEIKGKEKEYFQKTMGNAMKEGRRILQPNGIGIVVFAHKSTSGWEAQLQSMLDAGWIFTGSWPIDTERPGRLRANNSAALASSVHLVCRPREDKDGSLIQNQIGDWRDVQEELPKRIHEWMPRLAEEGVAGADAIFACLGPALEIFSRYTKVIQAGSEREISLREYLEKVWAAVSQEALNMVFSGGNAQGLEEDARLTAMWLWTLTAGANDNGNANDEDENDEEESSGSGKLTGGFSLEYDTARKIAQGLGANLEELKTLIEVKGDKARLLPVMERANKLFGATGMQPQAVKKKKKVQLTLSFDNVETEEDLKFEMPELKMEQTGKTVLDRLHQAMLLFSTGRTEALKRFLVEDGAGKDDRFWKLAQSLTSLYPKDTEERRWVEALQPYKKSLGF